MFCEQCGTKSPDDALFCENCGAKIVKPEETIQPVQNAEQPQIQPQAPLQPKKPFKMKPQILIPIIAGVVVILAAIGFVAIGKASSNPKKVVKNYLEAVVDQKWKKAYDMLDVKESEFLNEEAYVKLMEAKKGKTITNYKIYTDFSDLKKDEITRTVYYGYTMRGQTGELSGELQLIKQKDKSMLFFDKWQVSESYAENCYVVAPEGTTVTVDGVELDLEGAKEYEEGYVQFTIPTMFYGLHNVKATSDIFEEMETEWEVSYSEANCYLESGELKKEVVEEMETTITDMISDVYAKAYEGKEFSEISSYFTSDKSAQSDIQDSYDNLKKSLIVNESGEGFKKFSITEIETELEYSDGIRHELKAEFEFDYEKAELDWWSNELETKTGSSSKYVSMYVEMVDGDWVISSIYFPDIYIY